MTFSDMSPSATSRLIVRLMERQDLEALRQLHNHEDVLLKLTDPSHVSEVQQEAWFQSASSSKTARRYIARLKDTNELVGFFRIDQIDTVNGNAFVGCDVAPAHQGKGYATEIFAHILNYLFDACRLHRVELVTLASNHKAQGLYKKLGFVDEGKRRDAIFRDGGYQDLLAMGLLDTEWRTIRQRLLTK